MAQSDTDQIEARDDKRSDAGRTASELAARRQHLLLLSSLSSSSSSSSSTSSTCSSSSLSSSSSFFCKSNDGSGNGNAIVAGRQLSFDEAQRVRFERGHTPVQLQQSQRRRHHQQASHLDNVPPHSHRNGLNARRWQPAMSHLQSQPEQQQQQQQRRRRRRQQQQRQHPISEQPPARHHRLSLSSNATGSGRFDEQTSRQHSDGSSIGVQLMNVLKINDDLSNSASGGNMLMTHTQQQQQQQQTNLDARLNSSMDTAMSANLTSFARQQVASETAARPQPLPVVLVSPVGGPHPQHEQQEQYPDNQPQDNYSQANNHFGEPYALVDHLVPATCSPGGAPFLSMQHHNHQHHHQHHHRPDQLINRIDLYQAPGGGHYEQLIDDAQLVAAYQNDQQDQPTLAARSLPESVVRANEQLLCESQQQHGQPLQTYYAHQHDQPHQQNYAELDGGSDQRLQDDLSRTTLTALNSVITSEPDRQQHCIDDGLKRSNSASWRQNLAELSSASTTRASGYIDSSIRPEHSFDRVSPGHHNSISNSNSNSNSNSTSNHHHHHHHHNYQRNHRLDGSFVSIHGSFAAIDDQDQQQRPRQRTGSSSCALEALRAASQSSSNDIDEELKVCEWRDCGNTFMDMNEFVRHLEEKHVNLEPHEKNRYFCLWHNCKRNTQEFNARYKLLIHMRVHSGEKPYSCQSASCKKSFSRLENLKIHVRSHTGEKPYKCSYEHCSKSFTNSSDRIKHHKTHKDPKPYNCTHDGCLKRYTDPSSLRKHLRAHKRDNFGSMDLSSAESPANLGANSIGTSSFSSQMDHTFAQSSSAAIGASITSTTNGGAGSDDYHRNHHHQHQHHHHQHQQQQQQQQQVDLNHHQRHNNHLPQDQYHLHGGNDVQYAYAATTSGQHDANLYEQQHHNNLHPHHHHHHHHHHNHHHHQQQQQQQHQEAPYLHADYDPSREFANVLFSSSNASEIATSSARRGETQQVDEANYYVDANFDRPHQPPAQEQEARQLTNLDEVSANSGRTGGYRSQPTTQVDNVQYITSSGGGGGGGGRTIVQRPSVQRASRSQMELQECHQQLAKSWCGGSSSSDVSMLQSLPRTSNFNANQRQQPRMVFQRDTPQSGSSPSSASGAANRRKVEFSFQQNQQPDGDWSDVKSSTNFSNQLQQQQPARYIDQQPPDHVMAQSNRSLDQDWSMQSTQGAQFAAENNQQARQIHFQQQQQQQQRHNHHHQRHPANQLTRRQQHEQLMRSMPASVSFFQS